MLKERDCTLYWTGEERRAHILARYPSARRRGRRHGGFRQDGAGQPRRVRAMPEGQGRRVLRRVLVPALPEAKGDVRKRGAAPAVRRVFYAGREGPIAGLQGQKRYQLSHVGVRRRKPPHGRARTAGACREDGLRIAKVVSRK